MMYLLLIFTLHFLVWFGCGIGKSLDKQNEGQIADFIGRNRRAPSDFFSEYIFLNADIENMLHMHNYYRRKVVPQASDMIELTWDDDLEKLAIDYSKRCNYPTHRPRAERKTEEFIPAGENLAIDGSSPSGVANRSIKVWFDETKYWNFASSTCQSGKDCGHYTQLVWAETFKVGCGMSLCNGIIPGDLRGYLYVCNYGPVGNTVVISGGLSSNTPPFKEGVPCSACPENHRNCRDGLCTNATVPTTTTVPTTPEITTVIETTTIPETTTTVLDTTTKSPTTKLSETTTTTELPAVAETSGRTEISTVTNSSVANVRGTPFINANEETTTTSKGIPLCCGITWILFSLLASLAPFLIETLLHQLER